MNTYVYMMVLQLLPCLIAFFQRCICLVQHLFSSREVSTMFFWLLLKKAIRTAQSYAGWPHMTPLSTCTVQCRFLHCVPSACLVMVTQVRGPEGQASGGSWRAFWHHEPHRSQEEAQGLDNLTQPLSARVPLSFPLGVNFPISVHLLLHTISTPFFLTSRVPLLCFPRQHSWLWLRISSVSVSQGIKSMKQEFWSTMEGKFRSKKNGQILQCVIRDCNFWDTHWSTEHRKMQCLGSCKDYDT